MLLCSLCNNAQVIICQPATQSMFYVNKGRLIGSRSACDQVRPVLRPPRGQQVRGEEESRFYVWILQQGHDIVGIYKFVLLAAEIESELCVLVSARCIGDRGTVVCV